MSLFDSLSKRRDDVRAQVQTILDSYGDDAAELSEADVANLAELKETMSGLDVRLADLAAIDQANADHDALYTTRRVSAVSERIPQGSLGSRFVASSEFDAYRRTGFSGAAPTFTTEFTLVDSIATTDPLAGTTQVVRCGEAPQPDPHRGFVLPGAGVHQRHLVAEVAGARPRRGHHRRRRREDRGHLAADRGEG